MTTVFFRKEEDGEILAVFAFDYRRGANGGTFGCYAHIGQHSECCLDYIKESTKPATRDEYAPLLSELRQVGYDPIVIKKIPPMYL